MPSGVDPAVLFGFKKPDQAIAYLAGKGLDTSVWNWFDMAADAHARSFTVAKATRMDVLQSIRDTLLQVKGEGLGEREFIKRLTPILQNLGWWGKQIVVSSDGVAEVAQLGSPRRLRTIYQTNVASAYNAARYEQMLANSSARPYWQYVAVMDAKTRPSHAAMNGRVFRFDDPIWRTHYPPCAYNCRCRVRALSARDVERLGLTIESSEGHLDEVSQVLGVNKRSGEIVYGTNTKWSGTDEHGRAVSMTPDPGFGANPSLVPWQPNLDKYDADIARWYVGETLRGPAFARTWDRIAHAVDRFVASEAAAGLDNAAIRERLMPDVVRGERYPVAVLSSQDRALLDVRTQSVLLSDDTLLKQAINRSGQDMQLTDYWRVQPTIEHARTIVQQGDNIYAFFGEGDALYVAVLKRVNANEVFLQSFRRSSPRDRARMLRQTDAHVLREG